MRHQLRTWFTIGIVAALAACTDSTSPDPEPRSPDTPLSVGTAEQPSADEYIVVLKDDVVNVSAAATSMMITARGGKVREVWQHALKGFFADLPAGLPDELRRRSDVAFVERNGVVQANATQFNPPSWGLDRIDQRLLPLNQRYNFNKTGQGVHAYIIDTGIRPTHVDFGGRVLAGVTTILDGFGTNDCNGHGTHVAGTVGGSQFGVAKRVWLHPVRVLNCAGSGTFAGVITGVNWVAANKISPAVANLSLGGGFSAALNVAVNNLVNQNVAVAVAAGNSNANACGFSPASAANPLTVGSTQINDVRSGFSNFGPCLDLFAPGSNIRSTWFTSNVATAVLSGTSMASPHVAGTAALVRQAFPALNAFGVQNVIRANATVGVVIGAGAGSPNRLLYTGWIP